MVKIKRMERGTVSRLGGRPYYNHQTWREGRNVVCYLPTAQKEYVAEAIAGYGQFMELAEKYAEEVIRQTRKERKQVFSRLKKKRKGKKPCSPKPPLT